MPACSNPPNHPPPEVIDRLVDEVAWAKTCLLITAATKPGSPERAAELKRLRAAVVEPRRVVNAILAKTQDVSWNLLVELRTCELAIPKLSAPSRSAGSPVNHRAHKRITEAANALAGKVHSQDELEKALFLLVNECYLPEARPVVPVRCRPVAGEVLPPQQRATWARATTIYDVSAVASASTWGIR